MFRSAGVRRSFLALLATAALVAGACAAQQGDSQQVAAVRKPVTAVTTTAPTAIIAAPAAVSAAPGIKRVRVLPGDRPAKPVKQATYRGPTPQGRIIIPRIGLNHLTYEGIELSTIDYGPSHWPGTAMPGQVGNTVFPGHRVTHSRPFYNIDLIQIGDQVTFTNSSGRYVYEVTETFVVDDSETWIADPTETPTMTIFGCHPKHSAKQRYVVKGKLIQSERATSTAPRDDGGHTSAGDHNSYEPPPPETTTTTQQKSIIPRIGG